MQLLPHDGAHKYINLKSDYATMKKSVAAMVVAALIGCPSDLAGQNKSLDRLVVGEIVHSQYYPSYIGSHYVLGLLTQEYGHLVFKINVDAPSARLDAGIRIEINGLFPGSCCPTTKEREEVLKRRGFVDGAINLFYRDVKTVGE